ncbi:MAG TPA: DUF362 domain-containing protein [Candidatus Hydrogenedentes bacterium]|nr:DUF362 domain-containing protein [Candidatus Hydrogenedentota bacterium]
MAKTALPPTPFPMDASCPSVFVASGDSPYDNTRNALEKIDLAPATGKSVLLKPNAGRNVEPEKGVTTHPQVVAAAIDAFTKAGARVAVGESPIIGVDTLEAFAHCGIAAVAQERNCPLIDMDARRCVKMQIPDGIAIRTLKVCREILEFDIIVSMPVMKMHMHTGVTLAVKNMKGGLWRRSKVDLHMLPPLPGNDAKTLDIAIADMASVLRPHLAIIDGTIGMEGLGPSAGAPKRMDVVLAGIDAFAADAVACELMGVSARDIPHLQIGAGRGYGVIDPRKIRVAPDNWKDARSPFELPPENLSIEFPGVTVLDKQSCSACQSTLLLFLRRYGDDLFGESPEKAQIRVAIGKGHKSLPPHTLCIGNCTAEFKDGRPYIAGCPPVASEILKAYTEYFK